MPEEVRGVFVDETKCRRCYKCVDTASSTFAIHTDPYREDKAFVAVQYADPLEIVDWCIRNCPAKAIRYAARDDLPTLEYAMTKCCKLRARVEGEGEKREVPGPWEIMQENMIDQLLEMDMEQALQESVDPLKECKIAEELATKARSIFEAASAIPEDVRARVWPKALSEDQLAAQATGAMKAKMASAVTGRSSDGVITKGMERAVLKSAVFDMLDEDGDGFLFQPELRKFAGKFGFVGTNDEWVAEYNHICVEMGCSAMEGLDVLAFSRMVDDSEGCYLTNDELAEMLSGSGRLPRAGS